MVSATIIQGGSYGARLKETFNPEYDSKGLIQAAQRTGYAGGLFNEKEVPAKAVGNPPEQALVLDYVPAQRFG